MYLFCLTAQKYITMVLVSYIKWCLSQVPNGQNSYNLLSLELIDVGNVPQDILLFTWCLDEMLTRYMYLSYPMSTSRMTSIQIVISPCITLIHYSVYNPWRRPPYFQRRPQNTILLEQIIQKGIYYEKTA